MPLTGGELGISGVDPPYFPGGGAFDQLHFRPWYWPIVALVLSMVILGGLGSIWGVVLGALLLANINYYLIPDVLNGIPHDLGLNFNLTDLQVSIFGFLLVLVMVLRPQGLLPERHRRLELA